MLSKSDLHGVTSEKNGRVKQKPTAVLFCMRFEQKRAIVKLPLSPYQARGQNSATEGCTGGLHPQHSKIMYFGQK